MAQLEALSRGKLTRANSRVVAARVPLETAQRIARYAAAHRVAPHVFVRQALALLSAGAPALPDAEGVLADLTKALGLPEFTTPADVLEALQDLFQALGAGAPVDPLAATPDPPPVALSAFELNAIKRSNISETEYRRRKATAVRRTPTKQPNRKA